MDRGIPMGGAIPWATPMNAQSAKPAPNAAAAKGDVAKGAEATGAAAAKPPATKPMEGDKGLAPSTGTSSSLSSRVTELKSAKSSIDPTPERIADLGNQADA